ncbi:MAG: outer membrane lipid asymmetry maintenance protein MlaD [Desulfobulbaceae bacterium]|nr:outer membrane lipid asymmetry maintenance protein MlaD [Desulfobulbaceae bacterium]MCK5341207.1 outer membrane lipid asymmetry maintenance protein MlaD [Desulfobulbaceae bacterium]MCK5404176.1 outer membrane lipid asymmetry maintenance protein MlaD [Desulfobulbaceae bacterium]
MRKVSIDFIVGIFMIAGFLSFVYISLQFGEFSFFSMEKRYTVNAEFDSVSGLKPGTTVEIAGVCVGKVSDVYLGDDSRATVILLIDKGVEITDDAIASIRTQGIIGDKYIKILQGGSSDMLVEGDVIFETESAIDLEELISKYIFGDL